MIKYLSAIALLLAAPVMAQEETDSLPNSLIISTLEAAVTCATIANNGGINPEKFSDDPNWVVSKNGFHHTSENISITMVPDGDGISRICVVKTILESPDDQPRLASLLTEFLKREPIKLGDTVIWLFSSDSGARGIQFFTDDKNSNPSVKLIGAAF